MKRHSTCSPSSLPRLLPSTYKRLRPLGSAIHQLFPPGPTEPQLQANKETCVQGPGRRLTGEGCASTGTSPAGRRNVHGQLPKATAVCAVHLHLPPALTVTFNVSAPLRLGEGTRMGVTAQRLGGRGPGSGPWMAVLAPSPPGVACSDPAALHPASIRADRFPDTGGQSASTRAREELSNADPQAQPKGSDRGDGSSSEGGPSRACAGLSGGPAERVRAAARRSAAEEEPNSPGFKFGPPASVCLSVKWGRKACLSCDSAGLGGTCVRRLACSRCSQTAHRGGFCTTRGARRSTR